jgi:hypothetical protein
MTTILTKKKDTTGAPAPGDLTNSSGGAELAVNTADKRLYTKNSGGTVVEVGTNPATFQINSAYTFPTSDGTSNQVLRTNGSGALSFASVGTVTSVDVSGGTTGLTTSGGPVTGSGTITLAGTLAVANGGTGITSFGTGVATWLGTPSSANLASAVTDETGTGALVFANTPTLVTPVLGTPTSGNLSNCTVDGTDAVGFRNTPINSQSTAYTAVLADSGKTILHPSADTTARTFTIPANSSVAYPLGTVLTFVNQNGAGVLTIAITSDTMRLAGAGTTGSRTLAANGVATCVKLTSTEWIISGNGLT